MHKKSKKEVEHYTKWVHMENGKNLVRRIHRLEIQAADGRLYIVTGAKLPEMMVSNCGFGHTGANVAQILLKPDTKMKYVPPPAATPAERLGWRPAGRGPAVPPDPAPSPSPGGSPRRRSASDAAEPHPSCSGFSGRGDSALINDYFPFLKTHPRLFSLTSFSTRWTSSS